MNPVIVVEILTCLFFIDLEQITPSSPNYIQNDEIKLILVRTIREAFKNQGFIERISKTN